MLTISLFNLVSPKASNKSSHKTLKSLCWVKEQFIALDECKRCHPIEKVRLVFNCLIY